MVDRSILVFVKNLIPGQVKTRLAADVGIDKALDIYMELVNHTHNEVIKVDAQKNVYYSDYVEVGDIWDHDDIQYHVQQGNDLGDRMSNAFAQAFKAGADKVIIIGSDCYELKKKHIEQAFDGLEDYDVVIGPAKDGGYYLLGLNAPHPELFSDKTFSHDQVFNDLLASLQTENLEYELLETLSDIDLLSDVKGTPLEKLLADAEDGADLED